MKIRKTWKRLGSGCTRESWLTPTGYVVKIPINDNYQDNEREAQLWKERHNLYGDRKDWKLARCRLIPGTNILVMEYIKPIEFSNRYQPDSPSLPKWCYEVDGCQVGYNSKGEIVAYDYAEWTQEDFEHRQRGEVKNGT